MANAYKNITSNTTTRIKVGPGTLRRVVINTPGAAANTIELIDRDANDENSTVIGEIDSTLLAGEIVYDLDFTQGLVVVTATGTAPNITVVYE